MTSEPRWQLGLITPEPYTQVVAEGENPDDDQLYPNVPWSGVFFIDKAGVWRNVIDNRRSRTPDRWRYV